MSDDIVKVLRGVGALDVSTDLIRIVSLVDQAALEIERLRAELAEANADAELLATIARGYVVGHDGYGCSCYWCKALAAHRERIGQ